MSISTNKIIRIYDDERQILSKLHAIYDNDYKKYSKYIRQELHVPASIKEIYKRLDERQAYRRISDYFHRNRRITKPNSSLRSDHRSLTTPTSNLLSVHASIQKVLYELDRVIISKSGSNKNLNSLTNGHEKLNDFVRLLSTVVNQQQDTIHSITNESSSLLMKQSEESIKSILKRLNTLIDHSHSIYDKIENILIDLS